MERGYSILQAANLLGMKARTIREWVKIGKIKASKQENNSKWIIGESEIERIKNDYAIKKHSR